MADIGLATAAATANQLKSVLGLIPEEKGRPKFGTAVNPEKESKCPYLEVFMACHGKLDKFNIVSDSMELRRDRFKPNDTPLDARNKFGQEREKPVSQEDIKDENGFILGNSVLNSPMYNLSNGCRLNLNFTYKHNIVSGAFVKAGEEITSVGESVANVATNTPSWWKQWGSSSSSTTATSPSNDSD